MKLHLVSLMFFTVALSSGAQTVISEPEHQAKYESALQDASRYKADQRYYDNWVKVLQPLEPWAKAGKATADWTFDYETKIGTFIANKYDEYTAPKFANDAAGYEAERQYYERRVKMLELFEAPVKAIKAGTEASEALLDPEDAAVGYVYQILTDTQNVQTAAARQIASEQAMQEQVKKKEQLRQGIAESFQKGEADKTQLLKTINNAFAPINVPSQWGSQNTSTNWQCAPSQWNSQNSPVAWPKK